MPGSLDVGRVGAVVGRQMRMPIITLLVVYAVSVAGMTLIPGRVIDGETQYMSVFHAFYFMTYTATTTGFGEIPYEFSNAQRMWAIVCLYVSVVAWFYAIGTIIQLITNPYFLQALAERKFARQVNRLSSPFYIICGFGDTGSLLARGLSDADIPAVVIESEIERLKALSLRDYRVTMPGLCADASIPKHLIEAGLQRSNCIGIIIVTRNEEVNLRISVMAHVLNPSLRIVAMSKVGFYNERIASLGREAHIVDPFRNFSRGLAIALFYPKIYGLNQWIIGAPGASLRKTVVFPSGSWIICGYGRMGRELHYVLSKNNVRTAVIDVHPPPAEVHFDCYVQGRATEQSLEAAGIDKAVGILIATDDDGRNLGILVNARSLNPDLFTVVRQNLHENETAFLAGQADLIMQPSLVTARRIFFSLIAPLLKPLFEYLVTCAGEGQDRVTKLMERMECVVGDTQPHLMTLQIDRSTGAAAIDLIESGEKLLLRELLQDPATRDGLATVPLVVRSAGGADTILPTDDYQIREYDEFLFCGKARAHSLLKANIQNEYTLHYLQTGVDQPRGWVAKWMARKLRQRHSA
jgi:Trk K+ transport system NAD-binding subunit